jgi:hypothetical protein
MINLKEIRLYPNRYVDGQLDDGRLVEFKTKIPHQLDNLIRIIVAMANTAGGFIIFGVDERTLSVVGTGENINQQISHLETAIKKLSLGVNFLLTHEVVENKDVVILEIKQAESTAYFSRAETTPARQLAYRFDGEKGMVLLKEEMRYTNVFKYMTLDAFLTSLYCKSWRFFEPSKWNDKFEQRFYCANYTFPEAIGNTPQLFASCLTRKRNSEAAWKVYSHGQGLGAHCIQLELDIVELRKQLRASGFRFEEMPVEYKNEKVILNLHKKGAPSYNEYFSSFTLDSFLRLLSLKREAYEYEKELRLFIIPKNGGNRNKSKKAQHKDIQIDWSNVISKVRVDKKCSDAELVSIQRACFSVGINPIIKQYSFIGSIVPPPGLKDVEFERFDIDEMPGAKSVTIA